MPVFVSACAGPGAWRLQPFSKEKGPQGGRMLPIVFSQSDLAWSFCIPSPGSFSLDFSPARIRKCWFSLGTVRGGAGGRQRRGWASWAGDPAHFAAPFRALRRGMQQVSGTINLSCIGFPRMRASASTEAWCWAIMGVLQEDAGRRWKDHRQGRSTKVWITSGDLVLHACW